MSDERDRIYSILEMISPREGADAMIMQDFPIDYSKSPSIVQQQALEWFINKASTLTSLSFAGVRNLDGDIPSWCFDLKADNHLAHLSPSRQQLGAKFPQQDSDIGKLRIRGIFLGCAQPAFLDCVCIGAERCGRQRTLLCPSYKSEYGEGFHHGARATLEDLAYKCYELDSAMIVANTNPRRGICAPPTTKSTDRIYLCLGTGLPFVLRSTRTAGEYKLVAIAWFWSVIEVMEFSDAGHLQLSHTELQHECGYEAWVPPPARGRFDRFDSEELERMYSKELPEPEYIVLV